MDLPIFQKKKEIQKQDKLNAKVWVYLKDMNWKVDMRSDNKPVDYEMHLSQRKVWVYQTYQMDVYQASM